MKFGNIKGVNFFPKIWWCKFLTNIMSDPLICYAQGTYYSVLGALHAGLMVPFDVVQ